MSILSQGLGRDTDVVGAYSAFGMGIVGLLPVINASISFNTNLDIATVNSLTVDKDISFNLDLLASIFEHRELNPEVQFDIEAAVEIVTQANYNPKVTFNTNLDADFVKQLVTDAGISLDIELSQDQAAFIVQFFLEKQNVYVISEELRFLKVFEGIRICEVSEELRAETVKYENRICEVSEELRTETIKFEDRFDGNLANLPVFVFDNFNRAGPGLGANWLTGYNGYVDAVIVNNRVEESIHANWGNFEWVGKELRTDQFAEFEIHDLSPAILTIVSISLRADTTADNALYFSLEWGGGPAHAYGIEYTSAINTGGVYSNWSTYIPVTDTPSDGDVFRVEIIGTTARAYYNDQLLETREFTEYQGNSGVECWIYDFDEATWPATPTSRGAIDNFRAGNIIT